MNADKEAWQGKLTDAEVLTIAVYLRQIRETAPLRLRDNLEALKPLYPQLYLRFKDYTPLRKPEFFCTLNAEPNVAFDGRLFYQAESPREYCRSQVFQALREIPLKHVHFEQEQDRYGALNHHFLSKIISSMEALGNTSPLPVDTGGIPSCVLLGIGLGYVLEELVSQIRVFSVVAVEPDEDLFYASLQVFDWRSLLERLRTAGCAFTLIVGRQECRQQLMTRIYAHFEHCGRFLACCWWNLVHYASDDIVWVSNELKREYRVNYAAMGYFDDHLHALAHALHVLAERTPFFKADAKLPAEVADIPVFLVGGGPSLDNDLPFLRACQDKALIFACGTTTDTLYHAGIRPDFFCCTERTPDVGLYLRLLHDAETFYSRMMLLGSEVLHPDVLSVFGEKALFIKPDEVLSTLWQSCLGNSQNPRPVYMMNPLVGNFALSAALNLGFRRIYLFGFDCGRKKESKMLHSKANRFYGSDSNREKLDTYMLGDTVAGNFGAECESGYYYRLSILYLEAVIRAYDGCGAVCYNCSDGARIVGAEPRHSTDLVPEFARARSVDKTQVFCSIRDMTFIPEIDSQALKTILKGNEFLCHLEDQKALFEPAPQSRSDFMQAMMRAAALNDKIRHEKPAGAFFAMLLDGSMQSMFMTLLRMLYSHADEKRCIAAAIDGLRQYLYFLEDIALIYPEAEHYTLGPHVEILDRLMHGLGRARADSSQSPLNKYGYKEFYSADRYNGESKFIKRYS